MNPKRLHRLSASLLSLALCGTLACKDKPDEDSKPDEGATSQPADPTAAGGAASAAPQGVAAVINGVEISEARMSQAMAQIARSSGVPVQMLPPELRTKLRKVAEDSVISRELLKQHAKASGKQVEAAAVDAKYAEFLKQLPPGKTEADLKTAIGVGPEELKTELAADLAIEQIVESFRAEAKPSADAVRAFYDANAERFTSPAQISASHILLRAEATATPEQLAEVEKKAKEIAGKAKKADKEAFAKLADEFSEDPSAKMNHGDLGYFEAERMVPEFSEAAKKLKEGQVSNPVKSRFGYHIIRGQGQREAGKRKFDEVQKEIEDELAEKGVRDNLDKLVTELRGKAEIKVNAPPPPPPGPKMPTMPPMPPMGQQLGAPPSPHGSPAPAAAPVPAPAPSPAKAPAATP